MISRFNNNGIALIEILVAFVLASTSLGLLYNIQSNSRRVVIAAEENSQAQALLQSLLAEGCNHIDSGMNSTSDSNGKYSWELSCYELESSSKNSKSRSLNRLTATVSWVSFSQAKELSVSSLRPITITSDSFQ